MEERCPILILHPPPLHSHSSFIQDRAGRMGGDTPELGLEEVPQDASTKKLSECLKRIGDELDSNMELQRCGPWDPGVPAPDPSSPRSLKSRLTAPFTLRPRGPGPRCSVQHSGLPALPPHPPRILKPSFMEPSSPLSYMSPCPFCPVLASCFSLQPGLGLSFLMFGRGWMPGCPHCLALPPQHWLSSFLQDDCGRGHGLPPRGLFPSGS